MTKIGLVGAGQWGKNYVRNLAALGVLGAVCDSSEERLDALREAHPEARFCTSVTELAAMDDIAGCVVATDTKHHHPVARELLAAGKSCLVEKPLTDSADSALELCELAEAGGLQLMVGHILLYHPVVEHIKGMIERGELGEVYYITAIRANLGTIRRHENVMWSMAPHDISVVQYLLGEQPSSVSATGQAFVQPGIHDVTQLSLNFPDGRFASITSSWLDPEKVRLIKVVGSERMVVFNDMDPRYPLQVHEKGVDWEQFNEPLPGSAVKVRSGDIHTPFVEPAEPLKQECAEFVRSIETGQSARTSGRQGFANVRILAAADESLRKLGAPIDTGLVG